MVKMDDSAPAVPCGLVAKSFFNDTFELWRKADTSSTDTNVTISSTNIAWTSDVTYKFDNVATVDGKDYMDLQ